MELNDFMIIQRDDDGYARIPFSGKLAAPLQENQFILVRVVREDDNLNVIEWTKAENTDTDWSITLTVPEGGLYRFEASVCFPGSSYEWDTKIRCVYHIGVGDVYVTCGQSNMTGYGRDFAYDPPELGVHMMRNTGNWSIATHPLADAVGTVFDCPENGTGTSPALSFARRLKHIIGVPVGIIPTAVGGTSVNQWTPSGDGTCFRHMKQYLEKIDFRYKGYLWCQGCDEACEEARAVKYFDLFSKMLSEWENELGHHPMLTVQLNRWMARNSDENDRGWGMVRDAQRRAALELKDVYVVPAIDLPVTDGIHNSSGANVTIGERLANTAAKVLYGKTGMTAPTVVDAVKLDPTHVRINLTGGARVYALDGLPIGMNVEDADGMMDCTGCSPVENALIATTEREMKGDAYLHYMWRCHPEALVIRDVHGMPLLACYHVRINEQ